MKKYYSIAFAFSILLFSCAAAEDSSKPIISKQINPKMMNTNTDTATFWRGLFLVYRGIFPAFKRRKRSYQWIWRRFYRKSNL
jgi:hypothetical protein